MRTVAVTGGTGFLGHHLIPDLMAAGYEVRLLRRSDLDFNDAHALQKACQGAVAVVHAAGLVSYDRKDQGKMHATHVGLTKRMLDAAASAHVRRFVHVSSIVTIGYGPVPRNEASPYNASDLRLAYWDTKTEAERLALERNSEKLEVVVVNPGSLLGEGEKNNQLRPFINKLAVSERPVLPDGGSDFLDARDAARGVVLALEKGRPGERYILGSENMTYAEFHRRLRGIYGKKSQPRVLPRWLLGGVERALELIENVTKLDFPVNAARLRRVNGVHMFHSLEKARAQLGYDPQPIDRALRAMLEENRENLKGVEGVASL